MFVRTRAARWCNHWGSAHAVAHAQVDPKVRVEVEEDYAGESPTDFSKDSEDSLGAWNDSIFVTTELDTANATVTIVIKGGPFHTRSTESFLNQQSTFVIVVTDSTADTLYWGEATLSNVMGSGCADFVVSGDLNSPDFAYDCDDSLSTVAFLDSIVAIIPYGDTTFNVACDFHAWVWHDSLAPGLVDLTSFDAIGNDASVEVTWKTASEVDNAGFNIHRGMSQEGPTAKINDRLIPAQGSATEGATYAFVDHDVTNGVTYYYWLEDVDLSGRTAMHGPASATPMPSSVAEEPVSLPTSFDLAQNYPNPFNAATDIRYSLPVECDVNLTIFNLAGQAVQTLVYERQQPGHKTARWDVGDQVTSGVYFIRMRAGDFSATRKIVLLR